MKARFMCRVEKRGCPAIEGEVRLPLKAGVASDNEAIATQGRMRAARAFKREKDLHPCVRVQVEYLGVTE